MTKNKESRNDDLLGSLGMYYFLEHIIDLVSRIQSMWFQVLHSFSLTSYIRPAIGLSYCPSRRNPVVISFATLTRIVNPQELLLCSSSPLRYLWRTTKSIVQGCWKHRSHWNALTRPHFGDSRSSDIRPNHRPLSLEQYVPFECSWGKSHISTSFLPDG